MREILIDLTADDTSAQYRFAGYEGEHNATELTVILPERLKGKEGAEYRFLFETAASEAVFSAPIPLEGDSLSVKLTKQLMRAPILKAFVGCYVLREGEVVLAAKSAEMLLGVQKSVSDEQTKLSGDGGTVPGLVIEKEVIDSKNPVSSAAILAALNQKIDRFELGSVLPDSENASDKKPVSEKAVAVALEEGLEEKIGREELSPTLPDSENASDKKPVSEKAVADVLKALSDGEGNIVDDHLSSTGKKPVAGGVLSSSVAPKFQGYFEGGVITLNDVSPLPHKVKLRAVSTTYQYEQGEKITTSDFATTYVEVNSTTYLRIKEVKNDALTFYNGKQWVGSGQLDGSRDGVLSDYFSAEDYVCIMRSGSTYEMYQTIPIPVASSVGGTTVKVMGKNLFDPFSLNFFPNLQMSNVEAIEGGIRVRAKSNNYLVWTSAQGGFLPISMLDGKNITVSAKISASGKNVPLLGVGYASSDASVRNSYKELGKTGSFTFLVDKNHTRAQGCTNLHVWFYTNASENAEGITSSDYVDYTDIQIEIGDVATEYVPCVQTVVYVSDQDGLMEVESLGGDMNFFAESNITLRGEYNRDIGKSISRLEKAILDLGGNL